MFTARLGNLRAHLSDAGVEAFLVTSSYNRFYLSGFQGSSGWLLITSDKAILITDFRYITQAKEEALEFEVVMHEGNKLAFLRDVLSQNNIRGLGFESEYVPYDQYEKLNFELPGVKLIAVTSVVEKLRSRKDCFEIECIRKAARIADDACEHILGYLKPGMEERDVAAELEYFMRKRGASKPSFDTIIASGFRSALPHGTASNKVIACGDFVVMDFGALADGYCSDMTRTVAVGKASNEQKRIYSIVLEAQLAALDYAASGRKCCEVDALARRIIAGHGFGKNFGHSLGHGVGLEVHESPPVSMRNTEELGEGMVITIEPGIYIDGWGGVRIEDMIVLTDEGCEILTKSTKELIEVD